MWLTIMEYSYQNAPSYLKEYNRHDHYFKKNSIIEAAYNKNRELADLNNDDKISLDEIMKFDSTMEPNSFIPNNSKDAYRNLLKKYIDNENLFIKDISKLLTSNEKTLDFLLKNKDVDMFCGVISTLDFMQHYLWKHIDKNHPSYKVDNPYQDEFIKLLKRIDNLLED